MRIFFCIAVFSATLSAWTHLELGAGNYGAEGHTRGSQQMTVLKKLMATEALNYVHELPESYDYLDRQAQYKVLFDTLDGLIKRHGHDDGTFYVNDLFSDYAEFAAARLSEYAQQQGHKNLKIEVIAGDYEKTEFPGAPYDSVHLKNAEVSFYHDQMDGDEMSSTEQSIDAARRVLQKLANLSKDGLYFNVVFHSSFIPENEMKAMVSGEFYQETQNWPRFYYYFPEGQGKVIPLVKNLFIARHEQF
ncbi:MAG: hypothetical protein V4534_02445 [Myxococcota bacterium]